MRKVLVPVVALATALFVLVVVPDGLRSGAVITPALVEGDPVAGVGNVTRIDNLAVNDTGTWAVEADTDDPNGDTDSVLVLNGSLLHREGEPVLSPAGATLDSFDSVQLDNLGNGGFNHFLDGPPSSADSGVYFKDVLVIQESDVSTAPQFSPGTPYIGFFDVKPNSLNQLFVVASIDDPAIPTTVDRALVIVQHDGAGNLVSETVLAKEGDILPGQTEPVADFDTGPHESAFNSAGQVLYRADLAGATATDGALYLDLTLLGQEGSPSPVPGRNYEFLLGRGGDLSGAHWVTKANLDGATTDDDVIVLDGALFRQEGQTLAAISPFLLTSFGVSSGPVEVDDAGNVLWYGDWDDPNTDVDTGLFLNDQLLVQEGVTTVGGVVIDTIANGEDAFQLSSNGDWAIFEATLVNGLDGAFLIQLPAGGCTPGSCDDDNPCTDDECNTSTGECEFTPDDTNTCTDGDACTADTCSAGECASAPITCDDEDPCTIDSCDPESGCVTEPDTTPPVITVQPSFSGDGGCAYLWPPQHGYVDFTIADTGIQVSDPTGPVSFAFGSCQSSQPENGPGDGNSDRDCVTSGSTAHFRAERSGTCHPLGRSYSTTITATNVCGVSVTSEPFGVCVWHDRSQEPAGATVFSPNPGSHQNSFRPGVNGTYGTDCGPGCAPVCDVEPAPPVDPASSDNDGDGIVAAADNCADVYNPAQLDFDGNGEGDACDANDLLVDTLSFSAQDSLFWAAEGGATLYHLYRAPLANPLVFDQPACVGTFPALSADDPTLPDAGQGFFYLVTGTISGVETAAGRGSDGAQRPLGSVCP